MRYSRIEPIPALKPYVKCFWTLEGNSGAGQTAHRLFADALPNLVFHYQNYFYSQPQQISKKLPSITLAGHSTQMQDLYVNGSYGIFGVCVYPWTISRLWGVNARLIRNQEVDLVDAIGSEGRLLGQKILACTHNDARLELFQTYLLSKISRLHAHPNRSQEGIKHLVKTAGLMELSKLAYTLNCSLRTLERCFKQDIGLSPKTFSRILRFQHSLKLYEQGAVSNLTQLAYSSGFYDQPHFIKEFRLFSGMQPKHYFKNLPFTAEGFAQL